MHAFLSLPLSLAPSRPAFFRELSRTRLTCLRSVSICARGRVVWPFWVFCCGSRMEPRSILCSSHATSMHSPTCTGICDVLCLCMMLLCGVLFLCRLCGDRTHMDWEANAWLDDESESKPLLAAAQTQTPTPSKKKHRKRSLKYVHACSWPGHMLCRRLCERGLRNTVKHACPSV